MIVLIALIAVLTVVLLLKTKGVIAPSSKENKVANTSTSSTYSQEDIKTLILKGKENLNNMQNVYYEWYFAQQPPTKFYYKENKRKREIYYASSPNTKGTTMLTVDGNYYYIDHQTKTISISQNTNKIDYGFQTALIERASSSSYEFVHLKNEKLDEKDCIVVRVNYQGTSDYIKKSQEKNGVTVYWIEKSTGFSIGEGRFKSNQDNYVPSTVCKNITFDIVQDSDFEIPSEYKIV